MGHFTSLTAPGVHDLDPASLIWPGQNQDKALLNKGVDELAVWIHRLGASDLHMQAGEPAKINLHGRWFRVMDRPISEREMENALIHIYGAGATAWLLEGNDFTVGKTVKVMARDDGRFAIGGRSVPGGAEERYRFRWHGAGTKIYGANSCQLTARVVERDPPILAEMGLEPEILEYYRPDDGLVLVTGSTSQGKSRLLAGFTRSFLEDPNCHGKVVEFASPYEYEFDRLSGDSSMYAVSEIPSNYRTGESAMSGVLHRAPRVIIAPEIRDAISAHFTMLACQTGHLTMSTTHTINVSGTMQRLLVMFPHSEREQRAISLMQSLRLIISCKLVPSTNGKRTQLREFLPFTGMVRRQLLSKDYDKWPLLCEQYLESHGQSFVRAAEVAEDAGLITSEVASRIIGTH